MREIKFRAWSKLLNKMLSHEDLNKALKNLTKIEYIAGIFLPLNSDNEIMQYTGLNDKNGNEIYEGDILKGTTKGNSDEILAITYVKWDRGQFDLFTEMTSDSWEDALFNYMQFFDVEVMGNIYENPELLEEVMKSH